MSNTWVEQWKNAMAEDFRDVGLSRRNAVESEKNTITQSR